MLFRRIRFSRVGSSFRLPAFRLSPVNNTTAAWRVHRTGRILHPFTYIRPVEHKVVAEIVTRQWIRRTTATLFTYPRDTFFWWIVGLQASGKFFFGDEI
jgi:hypothetical protein